MDKIRIEGIEEAERVLDRMIREYPKQTVASGLRAAAKPFVDRTKSVGPTPQFSKLAGVKVYTKGRDPLMVAGQFGGKNKRVWKTLGSYMSMYYISYWRNYGTLSNRSTSYHFKNARKAVSSKWKGGVRATKGMDKVWEDSKARVISAIPVEMRKAGKKYLKKHQR